MPFADPYQNIRALQLADNALLADIGAGSGFYTFAAAEILSKGKVYAIDVQKDLLQRLKTEGSRRHLPNIECVWANAEKLGGTKLRDGLLDAAVISNVLFQIEDKNGLVKEMNRILHPKAKILLVDWSDSYGGLGPHRDEVVTKAMGKKIFETGGHFRQIDEFNAGDHHWGIILEKI